MDPTQTHSLAAVVQHSEALVFDRRRKNRRPAFVMQQTLCLQADEAWQAQRDWRAVGPERVASERITWRDGLLESTSEQPFLEEMTRALPQGQCCTWSTLLKGAVLPASYLVLKVQCAATVHLQRGAAEAAVIETELVIAAIPAKPVMRWLFASTRWVFDVDAPRLRRIEGLLDPRDLKPGGRRHEYLGTIEFTQPLDLRALVAQGPRQ